jgi:uncharacterized RDD family membrane protein YckC
MRKEKEIIIETPEKIRFSYRTAEIGSRIAAYIIDQLIQVVVTLIILWPLIGFAVTSVKDMAFITAAFFMIITFLMRWFYYVLFELIMEGQSPGKKLMRIRVVRDNGDSLDFETIIFRNFLRIVDDFPMIPLLGGFVSLIDPRSRRLGDLVANTIVVKEIHYRLLLPDFQVNLNRIVPDQELVPIKRKLNEDELYIIRRFLNDYHKLPVARGNEVAWDLARQVQKKIGTETEINDVFLFLERIYHQHGTDY